MTTVKISVLNVVISVTHARGMQIIARIAQKIEILYLHVHVRHPLTIMDRHFVQIAVIGVKHAHLFPLNVVFVLKTESD